MKPAYRYQYNSHPDFIGVSGMLDKLRETRKILEEALTKNEYTIARNPDFAIWCFPYKIPSRFGYKYALYDEWEQLPYFIVKEYEQVEELLLSAYGFDCDTGKFSINVPPIDIRFISELMTRVTRERFSKVKNIIHFICGFIDAGYTFIYNGFNENSSWLTQRFQQYGYNDFNVELYPNNIVKRIVSQSDNLILNNNIYNSEILHKSKIEKSYTYEEYRKEQLRKDCYGNMWFYVYDENDHFWHVSEYFKLVDDAESVNALQTGGKNH